MRVIQGKYTAAPVPISRVGSRGNTADWLMLRRFSELRRRDALYGARRDLEVHRLINSAELHTYPHELYPRRRDRPAVLDDRAGDHPASQSHSHLHAYAEPPAHHAFIPSPWARAHRSIYPVGYDRIQSDGQLVA